MPGNKTKFIIVTGSVISSLGKGTFTSSLGTLLKMTHGMRVAPLKFDGYLNVDAGTLNPYRHGEVFVLDDGTECDLDLGSYERMLNTNLTKDNYLTAGKLFFTVITKERRGEYLGRDVQFIPHVTGEIKAFVSALGKDADVIMVEVGGTIGDLENSYFIEAMRELALEKGRENFCFVNLVYIIEPACAGEQKTKAAQLGVRGLLALGIQPDLIVCRSENPISDKIKEKMSVFSNLPQERVISLPDKSSIYDIPLYLKDMGVDKLVCDILGLKTKSPTKEFNQWKSFVSGLDTGKSVTVAITGKYTELRDSYFSILKAIEHASFSEKIKTNLKWIETSEITNLKDASEALKDVDGMIIPGGFGSRGTEGKMLCIQHARTANLPFLGLCYGFQLASIEFARNVCGLKEANSTEIDPKTKCPVIDLLPEQKQVKDLGGSMRLGGHDVDIKTGTQAHKIYGSTSVRERFRHRYELNPEYIKLLESKGLVFSGKAPNREIMQILELPNHRFFMATQFHPEYTSKPLSPNPLFRAFVKACKA